MEIQDLLESKCYVRNGVTFKGPDYYMGRFMEMLPAVATLHVETSGVSENAEKDSEEKNIAYGRALLKAKVLIDEEVSFTCGLVYALDIQKPVIKSFVGMDVNACTNLCIFNAEHLVQCNIMDGIDAVYDRIQPFIEKHVEVGQQYMETMKQLKESIVTKDQVHKFMGRMLENSLKDKQIGTSSIISASNALFDGNSKYAISQQTGETTRWNVYQSFTAYISDKTDITEKANKTLNLAKYFLN